jgi:hypothetical protein
MVPLLSLRIPLVWLSLPQLWWILVLAPWMPFLARRGGPGTNPASLTPEEVNSSQFAVARLLTL